MEDSLLGKHEEVMSSQSKVTGAVSEKEWSPVLLVNWIVLSKDFYCNIDCIKVRLKSQLLPNKKKWLTKVQL